MTNERRKKAIFITKKGNFYDKKVNFYRQNLNWLLFAPEVGGCSRGDSEVVANSDCRARLLGIQYLITIIIVGVCANRCKTGVS